MERILGIYKAERAAIALAALIVPKKVQERKVACRCLRCDRVFGSTDKKMNRICSRCKRDNRRREDRGENSSGIIFSPAAPVSYLNSDPIPSDLDPLNYPKNP